jgi:hypothetical protein
MTRSNNQVLDRCIQCFYKIPIDCLKEQGPALCCCKLQSRPFCNLDSPRHETHITLKATYNISIESRVSVFPRLKL